MTAVLPTSIDPRSAPYEANRAHMQGLLDKVLDAQARVLEGGGDAAWCAIASGGGCSPGSASTSCSTATRRSSSCRRSPAGAPTIPSAAALVSGIGLVEGIECVISANDPTVRGGTSSPATIAKSLRAQEIALRNRLPLINLTESGGADLPKQAEIFVPGGATFKNLTRLSAAGIPTVTLVFGSSTAGGAYVPGMSDYTMFVKDQAKVFLGGPPLVKMAIDEDADEEELGGAEMHARTSGLADYLAVDEVDAIRLGRHRGAQPQLAQARARADLAEPSTTAARPRASCSASSRPIPRVPFDVREIIWRVVDASRFDEFKPLYGTQLVTGWASIWRLPDRYHRQQRHPLLRGVAEGRAVHPALQPARHPAAVRPEHHRLHGGHPLRAGRHHQARRPCSSTPCRTRRSRT